MSNYMVKVRYVVNGDTWSMIYSFENKSKTEVMSFCDMLKEASAQRHVDQLCESYLFFGLTMIKVNGFKEEDEVIINWEPKLVGNYTE